MNTLIIYPVTEEQEIVVMAVLEYLKLSMKI
ncbi:hypothetical protein Cpin_4642 [Chitinophaga pinensis DSM 2588]|uniref:Uncharacterized protein n=1 Tax=Chitinophaga pinensis (strain ATCC 43595 / DSM 2588 / LMG 13176 / NBRC 15968 / NCIMB 11800 / UQM 2034) TaxID=485918 RepID=A0A979G7E7_CHIPD|nr:hypothetical protein Cpin_4642 [Chitinophaga pinensis DSM 2588]